MYKKCRIMIVKKIRRAVIRHKLLSVQLFEMLLITVNQQILMIFIFWKNRCWRRLQQQQSAASGRKFVGCTQKSPTFIADNYSDSNCDRAN